jgi:hypothetical protein
MARPRYDEEHDSGQGILHHEPPEPRFAPDELSDLEERRTMHREQLGPRFVPDDLPLPEQGPVAYPLGPLDPEQPTGWNPPGFVDPDRY